MGNLLQVFTHMVYDNMADGCLLRHECFVLKNYFLRLARNVVIIRILVGIDTTQFRNGGVCVLVVHIPYIGLSNQTFGKTIFECQANSSRLLITSPMSKIERKVTGTLYEVIKEYCGQVTNSEVSKLLPKLV